MASLGRPDSRRISCQATTDKGPVSVETEWNGHVCLGPSTSTPTHVSQREYLQHGLPKVLFLPSPTWGSSSPLDSFLLLSLPRVTSVPWVGFHRAVTPSGSFRRGVVGTTTHDYPRRVRPRLRVHRRFLNTPVPHRHFPRTYTHTGTRVFVPTY